MCLVADNATNPLMLSCSLVYTLLACVCACVIYSTSSGAETSSGATTCTSCIAGKYSRYVWSGTTIGITITATKVIAI